MSIHVLFLGEEVNAFIRFSERCVTLKTTENRLINIVVPNLEHSTGSSPGGLVEHSLLGATFRISDCGGVVGGVLKMCICNRLNS